MLHLFTSLLLLASSLSIAHEGHTHAGEPPEPPPPQTKSPRIGVTGDSFELVAIARAGQLEVYLDDADSNRPLTGAKLELETRGNTTRAQSVGDHYRIDAPWLAQAGRHLLVFSVEAGQQADLMATELTVPPPAKPEPHGPSLPGWLIGSLAVAATLLALFLLKRKWNGQRGGVQ